MEPPKLDGILDDQVWTQGPMPTGQWVSYNPNRGDKMPDAYKTDVRVANPDVALLAGMYAPARLVLQSADQAITLLQWAKSAAPRTATQ